jgi:TPR repeat protein
VLLGGVLTGTIVAGLTSSGGMALAAGALNGFLSALAFLPVCGLVLAAARRAARARMGSIVAGSDRRAVWVVMAGALCVTTLAALPDWPAAAADSSVASPVVALGAALAAGLVILVLMALDVRALLQVKRAARSDVPMEPRGEEDAAEDVPRVDLGLGDHVFARVARAPVVYRTADRTLSLLLGSPEAARAALRRALLRSAVALGLLGLVVSCHQIAGAPWATIAYHQRSCERGSPRACRAAALGLEARGEPADLSAALPLHVQACDGGDRASCAAVADILEQGRGVPVDLLRARAYHSRICDQGDARTCRGLAHRLLRDSDHPRDLDRATMLLRRACHWEKQKSCSEQRLVEEARASLDRSGAHPGQDDSPSAGPRIGER